MNLLNRRELEAAGLVPNPNMWIGSGWFYCRVCRRYTYHEAWSHTGESDCVEVCKRCECYSGTRPVAGQAQTAAPVEVETK